MHVKFWLENPKERDHLEDLGVGERIILEYILGTWSRKLWTRFTWLRIRTSCVDL
jgi:hypothetical protein